MPSSHPARLSVLAALGLAFAACSSTPEPQPTQRDDIVERSLERLDTDGNGVIAAAEFDASHRARFAQLDRDGSGALSRTEFEAMG